MTDDIVARLRVLTNTLLLGDFQGLAATTAAAADEIERLRKGGCARDQRTTQFCAEAVELQGQIERLREALRLEQEELAACCIDRRETQRERDEARRRYCFAMAEHGEEAEARQNAKDEGWDCFKEER